MKFDVEIKYEVSFQVGDLFLQIYPAWRTRTDNIFALSKYPDVMKTSTQQFILLCWMAFPAV